MTARTQLPPTRATIKRREKIAREKLGLSKPVEIASAVPVLDPTRSVHRAIRANVEAEGDDAPRLLYWFFDLANALHFERRLAAPLILISPTSSPRALGEYSPRDTHGLRSTIRISPGVLRRGLRFTLGVLLHEMVHAWASEVLGDTEAGYVGHGPKFAAQCNAIGAVYGWPEVSAKGRNEKAQASSWPQIERFDDDPEPAEKKPKAAPAPASTSDFEASNEEEEAEGELTPEFANRHVLVTREGIATFIDALASGLIDRGRPHIAKTLREVSEVIRAGTYA